MFDDMSIDVLVWEEKRQHLFDHPGLLKQLAQGSNYLVGEYDTAMPECVQFMDPVTSKGASNTMLDEMQNMPVVWDDELLHGLDCQDALEHEATQFDKCLDVDNNTKVDLDICDVLTHSSDMDNAYNLFIDMPLEVTWDEEMQSDIDTNASLLQQLALSVDDKKTCTVGLKTSVVLTRADTSPLLKQCMGTAHQVCGGFPSKVVVWDDELFHDLDSHDGLLQQLDAEMDNPLECKHAMFKASIMSNGDVPEVSDEFLQGVGSQNSLLESLAHEECLIGMDNKEIAEPVSCKAPVVGELFDENPVWDDDPQYDTEPPDDMSLVVDHVAEALTKDFQVLSSVGCSYLDLGIIEQLAFSSKGTENTTVHSGSLQQLAWGREAFDSEMGQPELVCVELLTNVCSSTVSIHSDLQLSNQGCKLEVFVTCISPSDAKCASDLVLEDMIFGVPIIGTLCAGKRCFSLLINDSICISVLQLDGPWDPGVFHVVAWRQATPCGGGNLLSQFAGKRDDLYGKQRGRAFVQGQRCTKVFSYVHDFPWILELGVITVNGISSELLAVQELNHGGENLVIIDECQGLSGLHIVVMLKPRSVSTISLGNCKIEMFQLVLQKMSSWGWRGQLALITVRQWDPGIWRDACWLTGRHADALNMKYDAQITDQGYAGRAVAWGQATFCGGGNVTPTDMVYTQRGPHVRQGEGIHIKNS